MSENPAPEDRFCDLVMKGGITSGVVYPPAICELAQHYRFKNIGGTSAGAIAAVATAAAEYRRITQRSSAGFDMLGALPDRLGEPQGGKTQLLRLFQPDAPCRRLFTILVSALNAGGTYDRIAKALWGCLEGYWVATLLSLLLTALVAWLTHSGVATVLFLILSMVGLVGLGIYGDVTRHVVGNNYGLCKGLTTQSRDGPALTVWLHELIQDIAGVSRDRPLTFGDLWGAKDLSQPATQESEGAAARSVNLQMFTTNLSHGRPYVFPHMEPTARLFFRVAELQEYLPSVVVSWMKEHSIPYEQRSVYSDPKPASLPVDDLREIVNPQDFPVLLATRMSLSFPLLFSAVPLWAIDYEARRGERTVRRCLFSDGGIASNFPVHLFDGLLPSWPTFGIQLQPALPKLPDSFIFLPHEYGQGIADTWDRFDEKARPASRFGGFLASIVATMQNWNDNTLARGPGVRDRVVRLRLKPKEGGLNLDMPLPVIDAIAKRGKEAGAALVRRFLSAGHDAAAPPASTGENLLPQRSHSAGHWQGWDFQRWVRLDVLVRTLADKAPGLLRALGDNVPHASAYRDLLRAAVAQAPPGHDAPLSSQQADALQELLEALERVSREFSGRRSSDYPDDPVPSADIRVRPTL